MWHMCKHKFKMKPAAVAVGRSRFNYFVTVTLTVTVTVTDGGKNIAVFAHHLERVTIILAIDNYKYL